MLTEGVQQGDSLQSWYLRTGSGRIRGKHVYFFTLRLSQRIFLQRAQFLLDWHAGQYSGTAACGII